MRSGRLLPLVSALLFVSAAQPVAAASVTVRFSDHKGRPVDMGVAVATSLSGPTPSASATEAIMDQVDEAFVPHILTVQAGTTVSFPNKDDIRHHVYSFSPAKKFELPLYKGTPAEPVSFDEPGEVVLGCNIHDHMRGYLYVVESPYFAGASTSGVAEISELPAGRYEVSVWHPRQKRPSETQMVELAATDQLELDFEVQLKPALRLRGSQAGAKKY